MDTQDYLESLRQMDQFRSQISHYAYSGDFMMQMDPTLLIGGFFVFMIVGVVVALAKWDMYKKAGEPGWKSVIPIYDKVVLFHLVGESGWLAALLFVPFVKFFVKGFLYYKLARCFGYSFSFMLGLLFMPFIFFPILGFGKCQYKKVLPFEQGG